MLSGCKFLAYVPGISASAAVTVLAYGAVWLETVVFHDILLDGLVFAIVFGTLFHTFASLPDAFRAGVAFSSKYLLELAIVLLGVSVSVRTVAEAGLPMLAVVAVTVILSLIISYSICRLLGLRDQLATLVACGNSICGNSAIVAAAPVIGAKSDDVAASIAFTAALGIVVVLVLPPVFALTHLSEWQYGILAGMTVYAVPQVLAATAPVGVVSVQIGTLVKLIRVLMLGPVVLLLRLKQGAGEHCRPSALTLVPWFIVGFFAMMLVRTVGLLPPSAVDAAKQGSSILTIVSMAALGLSVNMRTVFASGGRVLLAGVLSIIALACLSLVGLAILHVS